VPGTSHRPLVALAVALAAVLALLQVGHADRGVGISTGEIKVANRLSPGGGYSLPRISVSNIGDEVTDYQLAVTFMEGQTERHPDASWFDFDPQRFTLDPGESRDINVALTVPAGAEPGDYFALLQAKTAPGSTGGTSVGVAAATKLTFSVAASGWLETQWRSINRWLDDTQPWTFIVPVGLILVFLATKAHKLPFRVRLERR
jgi:hypothetical protein